MRPYLTQEERELVLRIKRKWHEICNGLMHFTGTMRPLLLLEFQGYLDYLKINHKVGPCDFNNRTVELNAKASIEVYIPGKIGELPIFLAYISGDEQKKILQRWEAIICDIEERHNDKE